jgi:hypothetical protein
MSSDPVLDDRIARSLNLTDDRPAEIGDDPINNPTFRKVFRDARTNRECKTKEAEESARKPHLVTSNELPASQDERLPAQLTLVHDADALARDIADIGKLAIARIKETLSKPFSPDDPNYQALLRFTSGVYNSTMTTMLRADENLLRARAVDRLPELLERIAIEEKKRNARALDLDDPA